jgi:hypothetical protein
MVPRLVWRVFDWTRCGPDWTVGGLAPRRPRRGLEQPRRELSLRVPVPARPGGPALLPRVPRGAGPQFSSRAVRGRAGRQVSGAADGGPCGGGAEPGAAGPPPGAERIGGSWRREVVAMQFRFRKVSPYGWGSGLDQRREPQKGAKGSRIRTVWLLCLLVALTLSSTARARPQPQTPLGGFHSPAGSGWPRPRARGRSTSGVQDGVPGRPAPGSVLTAEGRNHRSRGQRPRTSATQAAAP